jgi:long-chain fatty acid transport protein
MRLFLLLLMAAPATSTAAGFYLTENGAKALMMGGAFAGEADDLSAMQHNPAGLAQLRGFNFLVDGQLLFHSITFQRLDPGFDPANPPASPANAVTNTGGPFPVPMLGLGYTFSLFGRPLYVGAGVYGPPSDGHYVFPNPNYTQDSTGKFLENARKTAPQRYSLIENNTVVVFPTASIAYAPFSRFALGVSLQPVVASFYLKQAITSIDRVGIYPTKQADEDPFYDSVVGVNMPLQYVQFTGVAGMLVRPTEWLQIGASFRPQVMINAKGSLDVQPGPAAKALATMVQGSDATLSLMLPAEAKLGVHVQPNWRLGINVDFVYQGWQSVQEIVLDPQNVYLVDSMHTEPQKVSGFKIEKHWNASYQARLGASFSIYPWITLYLGGWYETGAIPDQTISIDFLHFSRVFFTGGLSVKAFGLELMLGAAGTPQTTHVINNSQDIAGSTEPPRSAGVGLQTIGSGVYTSSALMISLGVRGTFGEGAKGGMGRMDEIPSEAPPAPVEPAPTTAPEQTPGATPTPAQEAPKS